MSISLLKSKIHHGRVTGADVDYVGSITIDAEIMRAVGIYQYERVMVVDVENGNRLETYTLAGEAGSRVIQLNGAAARLVTIGDRLIIMAFEQVEPPQDNWTPRIVVLNEQNEIAQVVSGAVAVEG
jgi:aspartate 1-decarboxylase